MEDYWFVWTDDYEPIRVICNREITSVMHRLHWKHIEVNNPFTDGDGRVEAFFMPLTHTPRIRKAEDDRGFSIFVSMFSRRRLEDYSFVDEAIPEYFTSAGTKDRHPPSVQYYGWEDPR